ncbi:MULTISPECIES: hypothetical protein [unclassified Paenibacillus]|uniref:hypothetical protein n=1 Tax=unclassified Paenibacillus TaxID=185978 RepID=UPI001C10DC0C|nr:MULTISPECIES: hypothetical protein [unclassified Paenibacillus]MBU5442949.1 hypothetical protein [Paenibacillus sp. MSJ-34]CAH0119503.1 hypothetical protein PAE9249_02007 [Paenibacillus sp. CECT 9249]
MNSRAIVGAVLVLFGVFLFLNRGIEFGPGTIIGYFWPSMFVLPLAIFFHWMYFSVTNRRGSGLLIPGGILFTVGVVCQISMLYDNWGSMWPGFILAPAVGLFEFYWFGNRNKWLLIPIAILSTLSILFFAVFSLGSIFNRFNDQPLFAIALIVVGAFLLIGWRRKSSVV